MDWSNKIFVGPDVEIFLNWIDYNFHKRDKGFQCYSMLRKDIQIEFDKEFKGIINYYDLKDYLLRHYSFYQLKKKTDTLISTNILSVQPIENVKDERELNENNGIRKELNDLKDQVRELLKLSKIKDENEREMRKEIKELKQQLVEINGKFNDKVNLNENDLQ